MTFRPFVETPLADALAEEIEDLRRALARAGGPLAGLVGRSAPMQALFSEIFAASAGRDPVIVTGESGAGKSAAAAAIHRLSARGREPMRTLVFDGRSSSPGLSEIAQAARAAATLVVEGHPAAELQRAAADETGIAGSRLVLVLRDETLLDPSAAAHAAFRISVPPLRERREDIPLLAEHFLGTPAPALDPKALDAMAAHDWSGNVRELRNVMRRARALSDDAVIGLTAIQSVLGGASARPERELDLPSEKEFVAVRIGDSMADIERRVLQRTLRFARGNKRKAAEMLKLSLKTIYNKVKEYGLEREFNRRFRKAPRSE